LSDPASGFRSMWYIPGYRIERALGVSDLRLRHAGAHVLVLSKPCPPMRRRASAVNANLPPAAFPFTAIPVMKIKRFLLAPLKLGPIL
jgi:hypothetical protein